MTLMENEKGEGKREEEPATHEAGTWCGCGTGSKKSSMGEPPNPLLGTRISPVSRHEVCIAGV